MVRRAKQFFYPSKVGAIIEDGDSKRAPFVVFALHHVWHTRVHAARIFEDRYSVGKMASEIPEMFDAFSPQLQYVYFFWNLAQYFRYKLLHFK